MDAHALFRLPDSVCTLCGVVGQLGAVSPPEVHPVFILPYTNSTSSRLISVLSKRLSVEKILKALTVLSNTNSDFQNATWECPLFIKTGIS